MTQLPSQGELEDVFVTFYHLKVASYVLSSPCDFVSHPNRMSVAAADNERTRSFIVRL